MAIKIAVWWTGLPQTKTNTVQYNQMIDMTTGKLIILNQIVSTKYHGSVTSNQYLAKCNGTSSVVPILTIPHPMQPLSVVGECVSSPCLLHNMHLLLLLIFWRLSVNWTAKGNQCLYWSLSYRENSNCTSVSAVWRMTGDRGVHRRQQGQGE